MFIWGVISAVCIIASLLIQYLCSSKLLSMKQDLSIKRRILRDVREEGERLEARETEIKGQQATLNSEPRNCPYLRYLSIAVKRLL